MAANVPTGSTITYQSTDWYSGWFTSYDDVVAAVSAALAIDGLTVKSSQINAGIASEIDKAVFAPGRFTVTLEVQVSGGLGYNSVDDVASIINHEVFQATGHLPASSTVPKVSLPGASVASFVDQLKAFFTGQQSTGQPSVNTGGGFSLSSLTSAGTMYIALAVFGFIAALALIGYSGALKRT